VFYCVNTGEI